MTERVRHVSGPGRLNHGGLSGVSTIGDEHDLDPDTAAYFCDELGYFERTGEITLSEDEYHVHDDADDDLGSLTYDELMERARDRDVSGRSSMDKEELIDALTEGE